MKQLKKAARILVCALREIFDEAAYARFLERNKIPSSSTAYLAFWRDRESTVARRTRCC